MRIYRFWVTVLILSFSFAPAPARAAAAKQKAEKQTAQSLVKDAEGSIAYIGKGLKTAKVAPTKANQPFLASLQKNEKNVAGVKKGLAAKSNDYYKALERLRRSANTLQITYSRSAIKDKQVSDGVKGLLASVSELDRHFSKEAVRRAKGGPLSDAEKKKLAALQTQQKEFAAKVAQLEAKLAADPKVDKDLKQKVAQMRQRSSAASSAAPSVASLTDTLLLVGELAGWWDGLGYYVPPSYRDSWVSIDDSYIDRWDVVYVETIEVVEIPNDWAYVSEPVTVDPDYFEVTITEPEIATYEVYVTNIEITAPSGDDDQVGWAEDVDASIEDIDAREEATDADNYGLESELADDQEDDAEDLQAGADAPGDDSEGAEDAGAEDAGDEDAGDEDAGDEDGGEDGETEGD